MHTFKKLLSVALLATAIPITTQAYETSGNVTLATDYKFRGISQNATSPAIQGGFDIAFDNGFYAGIWGSNVDFELTGSANPSMELDYYGGFAGNFTEDLSFDVGVLYYDYPTSSETNFTDGITYDKDRDLDYAEIYGSLGYKDFTVGFAYSDDYWQETGEFAYYYIDYSFGLFTLPSDIALDFHVGFNDFENSSDDSNPKDANEAFLSDGEDSYTDFSVTFSKSIAGLDFALSFVDTDLDEDECWGTDWCDSSAIFSISKSM